MSRLSLSHIDTCLACYLTDHHNREGELLLGVTVDGDTTRRQVCEGLIEEFNCSDREIEIEDGDPDLDLDDEFAKALDDEIPASTHGMPWDESLEVASKEDDGGDPVQAWFLLTW